MTLDEVRGILSRVTFPPSSVNLDWAWKVKRAVFLADLLDDDDERDTSGGFFLLRVSFCRLDRSPPYESKASGCGRWWQLDEGSDEIGVINTAYLACKRILEHELLEAFHYEGVRLFDPHHTVDDRLRAVASSRRRVARP